MSSEINGAGLYVSGDEFMKAANDRQEMTSLEMAVDAFYALFDMNNPFTPDLYDGIHSHMQRTSNVAFMIGSERRDKWAMVYVRDGNRDTIVYDGYNNEIFMKEPRKGPPKKNNSNIRSKGRSGSINPK
jgi:hypothetical protein